MTAPSTLGRATVWLILAADGPGRGIGSHLRANGSAIGAAAVHVVDEPALFLDALADQRPRIALAACPPADDAILDELARERRRRHGLRVVVLTAPADIETRLRALECGFDDALPASIDPRELAARLALLADRARRAAAPTLLAVTESAEIDLVAHELRRDDEPVHLRPKELRLLAVLAAHPGRAFTRQQLLDRVWGPGHVGDPRTVDVHVRWLRAKVEQDPERPAHLVTVRGVGYRLDPPDR